MRNATDISVTAGETQVQLRELERAAETYRNLYQTFLQRYQEAVQQQSFPVTEARIISRAVPPTAASEPRLSLVLALCLALGCGVGGAVAAFREFRDRFFRTGEQVRDVLGLEYLGSVPLVELLPGGGSPSGPVKGKSAGETGYPVLRRNIRPPHLPRHCAAPGSRQTSISMGLTR